MVAKKKTPSNLAPKCCQLVWCSHMIISSWPLPSFYENLNLHFYSNNRWENVISVQDSWANSICCGRLCDWIRAANKWTLWWDCSKTWILESIETPHRETKCISGSEKLPQRFLFWSLCCHSPRNIKGFFLCGETQTCHWSRSHSHIQSPRFICST